MMKVNGKMENYLDFMFVILKMELVNNMNTLLMVRLLEKIENIIKVEQ